MGHSLVRVALNLTQSIYPVQARSEDENPEERILLSVFVGPASARRVEVAWQGVIIAPRGHTG